MLRTFTRCVMRAAVPMTLATRLPAVRFHCQQKLQFGFSSQSTNNNDNNNNDKYPKAMKTLPLANYTAELSEEDSKLPRQEFCLFSSVQPIFPNNPMNCQIKIGNLRKILKPMLYTMISPDNGEVFTIGIVLAKSVEKNLNSELKSSIKETSNAILLPDQSNQTFNVDILTKPKNYRVRIVSIEMSPDGIFCTGIPYKDRPLNEAESNYNVAQELRTVSALVQQIKKSVSYDRIDAFHEVSLSLLDQADQLSAHQIDQLIYQIAVGLSKMQSTNLKVSSSVFVQSLLEAQTYVERLMILRKQLEMMNGVLDMVNKHFKEADSSLMKLHQQTLAKFALEYIKQNYLKDGGMHAGGGGVGFQQGPLGGQNEKTPHTKKYIDKLHLIEDEPSRDKIRKEIERFNQIDKQSSEFHKINTYLDEVFSLPYQKLTSVQWDMKFAQNTLDTEIEGLEKVKERIIEMIAVNRLKNEGPKSKGFILMLNGPPGTGKTSIAKAIAKALKRPVRFISCAGVSDPTFFKGHKRTYVDAMPGVFVRELIKSNTMNPVFILDEIDKVSRHHAGGADPYYTLLEILNTEENHNFTDHYLDIAFDFSHVVFILTSNESMNMLDPLKNRLEIIDVQAYIQEEKLKIANNFLVTKSLTTNGIVPQLIKYDSITLSKIIKGWCYQESGVRELKRCLDKIARKQATKLLAEYPTLFDTVVQQPVTDETKSDILEEQVDKLNQEQKLVVGSYDASKMAVLDLTQDQDYEILTQYLGPPTFDVAQQQRSKQVFPPGQVNILTVGGMIGHVLTVECCYDESEMDKKGQITSSGNIKNVLQESLKIAKINAFKFLTQDQKTKLREQNVHVHFMEGATPKDGPSAGTAITTALISIVTGFKVPSNLAMTGEISLLGQVCKIGGIQQKLIAAKTVQIVDVIVPYANMGETLDLPRQLLQGMNLYFVREYSQIYSLIFENHIQNFRESSRFTLDDICVYKDGVLNRPTRAGGVDDNSSLTIPQ